MVIESSQPIARIARDLNIKEGTLGNWVNTYRREHAGEYYSRGFPVCSRGAAQSDVLFGGLGYIASPPFGYGWLPGFGRGEESGVVVVPAGDGLVASASL